MPKRQDGIRNSARDVPSPTARHAFFSRDGRGACTSRISGERDAPTTSHRGGRRGSLRRALSRTHECAELGRRMSEQKRVFRQELTPTHFLERAGDAFADRTAVTDGTTSYTWREFRNRARR